MEFLTNFHILRTEICPDRSEHECAQVCSKFKMNSSEYGAIYINSCDHGHTFMGISSWRK